MMPSRLRRFTLTAHIMSSVGPTLSGHDLRALAGSPVPHAALALLVLLVATVLAVYKPRGMTWYGQRKHRRALLQA